MANITLKGFVKTQGLSFQDILSESLDDILDYNSESFTKTSILLKDDAANYMQFSGTDLVYKYSGKEVVGITSGKLTSFKVVSDGITIVNETGLSLPGKTLAAALDSGSTAKFLSALLSGNDTITGTGYADVFWGANGDDKLYGGNGNDKLGGDAGNDQLYGEGGNDALTGGIGNDLLNGGIGNDILRGQAGNDTLTGGAGKDTFIFDTALNATTNADTERWQLTIPLADAAPAQIDEAHADAKAQRKALRESRKHWLGARNIVGNQLLDIGDEDDDPGYAHYIRRNIDVDGYRRLVLLQLQATLQNKTPSDVAQWLASSADDVRNPYDRKPMQWDAASSSLMFEGREKQAHNPAGSNIYRVRL